MKSQDKDRGKQAPIPLLDLLVPFISALLGHTAHKGLIFIVCCSVPAAHYAADAD